MSITDVFAATRAEGRAALVGYLPAGFPSVQGSIDAMTAMVEGGCDLIEVGYPYSDPLMDGPVIQRAAEASLAAGTRAPDVIDTVAAVAKAGAPTVVMSYWNPIEAYGVDRFAADLSAAGGSGVITPDLIPDEAASWIAASQASGLDRIFLVAPSSTDARLASTAAATSGFVYAASTMGVTGERASVGGAAAALVARVRSVTELPICVGLGVSSGKQAAEIAGFADGVIVGSAFVRAMLDASDVAAGVDAVRALASELSAGCGRR